MPTHPGVHLVSVRKPAKKPASATGTWGAATAPKPVTAAPKAGGSRISGTGHATTPTMTQRTPSGGTALFALGPGGRWQLVATQADRPRASIPSGSGGSGGASGQLVAEADYSQHPGGGITTGGGSDSPRLNTGPNLYTNPAPVTAEPGYTVDQTQPGIVGGTITGAGFGGTGFNVSAPFVVSQPSTGLSVTLPPGLLADTPAFYDPGYTPGSSDYLFGGMTTMDASGNIIGGFAPSELGLDGFPATFGDTPASGAPGDSGSGSSPWSDAGSGGFF